MRAGLPVRSILISAGSQAELAKDAWSRKFVPIQLTAGGMTTGARIRYRGGHTREYPKKSYEIRLDSGLVLHLNAESDDPSMIRNALSFRFMEQIGVPAPRTRHVWVDINGTPMGLYLEIEAVNSRFFALRDIPYQSLLYAANDSANFEATHSDTGRRKRDFSDGYEFMEGDGDTLPRLCAFIRGIHRQRDDKLRELLEEHIDIPAYFRWLAGVVLTGNFDGFEQNYALYENANDRTYGILPWDYEGTWGRNCYGKPCKADTVRIQGYNGLTRRLLQFPDLKRDYALLLEQLLDEIFTEERLGPVIDELFSSLSAAVRLDTSRSATKSLFSGEADFIREFMELRKLNAWHELQKWPGALPSAETLRSRATDF
ncbi:CotH kinase family protein [Paenibacillus pasadenensis]|uniref:CotH kinase family protein n=1 Tax=Paenibacillus pasadenensis TaxID=217090 RepID=UPI00204069FD|nr:CotH kinase family protein [Paenibacillus pasadenensis]MCM3746812.1 CotH kinase family protein [Paenibacillus pasadenensis]